MTANEQRIEHDIEELLWETLRREPGYPDRRKTGWGSKTLKGLVASIKRIMGDDK